jgi:hypothetical protein
MSGDVPPHPITSSQRSQQQLLTTLSFLPWGLKALNLDQKQFIYKINMKNS